MTGFDDKQVSKLKAKLHPRHVSKRKAWGGNQELSYVEGWHAIAEANRIFGFDGWSRETIRLEELSQQTNKNNNIVIGYLAQVRVTAGGVIREGTGFGSGINKNLAAAHESAVKEAETDAMKRALITFGNPFGLALYDKAQKNVGGASKNAEARALYSEMQAELDACGGDIVALDILVTSDEWQEKITRTPVDWKENLVERYQEIKTEAKQQAA